MILFSHLLIAATPQFDGRKKCTVKKAKTRGYKVEYINEFFVMGTHFSVTGDVTCFFTLSGGAFPPSPPPPAHVWLGVYLGTVSQWGQL